MHIERVENDALSRIERREFQDIATLD